MALRIPFANDAKTYGFEWLRGLLEAGLQEGVLNMGGVGTDFKATVQTGTMRIDVAAGAAMVKGDSGTAALGLSQGLFMTINDAAIVTAVTVAAADATLPRIDQICLKIEDSSDLGSSADQATIVVINGTPTSGATNDNRFGAAALPANCLRLRDQLVPAAAATLIEANGRDRRNWARGAFWRGIRSSGNVTVGTATALLDSTLLAARIECSGAPVRLSSTIDFSHGTVGTAFGFGAWVDGAPPDGLATGLPIFGNVAVAGSYLPTGLLHPFIPAAGSHLIGLAGFSANAAGTALANTGQPLIVAVEEIVRANASNG